MDLLGHDVAGRPYLTIGAADLTCAQSRPGQDRVALLRRGTIEYHAEWRENLAGSRLFWGPYVALAAGVYLLAFSGGVEGELTLDFAHRGGNVLLKRVGLTDFAAPVCLVLTEPAADFEMQAVKTRELRALKLEAIAFHRVYTPAAVLAG
ncbi:MAG TPA: hypothetical protein VND87_18555 [Stellaceae bacterium]|nr:hypothetical protein [Stellaceae bacterium]